MSWYIIGDGESLRIKVLESGLLSIYGWTSYQEPIPSSGDINNDFYQRLKPSKCRWSIHPTNETELHLDPASTGFYEKLSENFCNPLSSINFFDSVQYNDEHDYIGVTIALPQEAFNNAINLFQSVLLHKNINYSITLGFYGFWANKAETHAPSFEEFLAGPLDGKGYISEEVSFTIRRSGNNA